jgi:hypothetical protein
MTTDRVMASVLQQLPPNVYRGREWDGKDGITAAPRSAFRVRSATPIGRIRSPPLAPTGRARYKARMTNTDERTVTISIRVPFMLNEFENLTRAALEAQGVAEWEVVEIVSVRPPNNGKQSSTLRVRRR